jgi:hypothetical protein
MPKKDSIKPSKQLTAFKEAARDLECDESEAAFDRALGKIGSAKLEKPAKAKPAAAKP